jgi:hypothetical protein
MLTSTRRLRRGILEKQKILSAIYGNEMLKKAITVHCIEYVDIFSRTLSDIHADIPLRV